MERVELEPAAGEREVARGLDVPREHRRELAAQRVGLAALPVLEPGRVAEAEALEQLAAELDDRGLEVAGRRQRAEAVDVDLERPAPHQADAVARGLDRLGPDRRPERRERAAQRPAGVLGVVLGPQQLREDVARPRPLDERQHREQRHRLARVERHGRAVPLHPGRAEQLDLDRHLVTNPSSTGATVTVSGRGATNLHTDDGDIRAHGRDRAPRRGGLRLPLGARQPAALAAQPARRPAAPPRAAALRARGHRAPPLPRPRARDDVAVHRAPPVPALGDRERRGPGAVPRRVRARTSRGSRHALHVDGRDARRRGAARRAARRAGDTRRARDEHLAAEAPAGRESGMSLERARRVAWAAPVLAVVLLAINRIVGPRADVAEWIFDLSFVFYAAVGALIVRGRRATPSAGCSA